MRYVLTSKDVRTLFFWRPFITSLGVLGYGAYRGSPRIWDDFIIVLVGFWFGVLLLRAAVLKRREADDKEEDGEEVHGGETCNEEAQSAPQNPETGEHEVNQGRGKKHGLGAGSERSGGHLCLVRNRGVHSEDVEGEKETPDGG